MSFESPIYAGIIFFILLLVLRVFYLYNWKKGAQQAFASPQFAKQLFQFSDIKQFVFSNALLIVMVISIMVALMDLIGEGEPQTVEIQGSDVVFCLDLSNSMNAEDIAPSRLEKAKLIIESTLDKTFNDRVGLVVFANDAYRVLPLTSDYQAFDSYIASASTAFIGDQGTRFERAIEEASLLFNKEDITSKNIVLISDGEDVADDVGAASNLASKNDLRIISVGVGTEKGSVIPEKKQFQSTGLILDEDKVPVVSRLDESSLKSMAQATGGSYIYATNMEDTAIEIRKQLKSNSNSEITISEAYVAHHYFQWFVGLALILLIIVSLTNIKSEFNI